jgi:hypothetical protein
LLVVFLWWLFYSGWLPHDELFRGLGLGALLLFAGYFGSLIFVGAGAGVTLGNHMLVVFIGIWWWCCGRNHCVVNVLGFGV